jgi:glycosyltransferase involved in cell wall biosynthesis
MLSQQRSADYRLILGQRLREAARVLCAPGHTVDAVDAISLLDELSELVRLEPSDGRLWLLFTAIAGAYPTPVEHEELRRELELASVGEAGDLFLAGTRAAAAKAGEWQRPLRTRRSGVVVDVNFCAKYEHNTGIQRVVRSVMPRLIEQSERELDLVAWTRRNGVTRSLTPIERNRVVAWGSTATVHADDATRDELVVPWKSRVFLPEVPEKDLCDRLAALAEFSGNLVTIIGYDTIPIGSADLVTTSESERFARYLTVVKHVDEVLAISESVANEFRGFAAAVAAQAVAGPLIHSIPLAADLSGAAVDPVPTDMPLIVSVGSHEPRKNQDAVLFAVESLLASGLRFRFIFVGGGNRERIAPFDAKLATLRNERGWDVRSARGMKDSELFALYREARFTVFASVHEGYGLPVVESLSVGTPVLTSNYGSLGEISAAGGCLTVDPRDDDAIIGAMRALVTDDELIARLSAEARAIPPRTWSDYAADLIATSRLVGTR